MSPDRVSGSDKVPLRVVVVDSGGEAGPPAARIVLVSAEGARTRLAPSDDTLAYEGRVLPGRYRLEAVVGRLVGPKQTVDLPADRALPVHLGEVGWPSYPLGGTFVPFPPPDELLAVAFPERAPGPEEALRLAEGLMNRLGMRPRQLGALPPTPLGPDFRHARGAIWVFQLEGSTQEPVRQRAAAVIREVVGERARVGILVDRTPGQLKVIDNRVTVRFRDDVEDKAVVEILARARARLVRPITRLGHAIHLVDLPGGPMAALDQLTAWRDEGLLAWGEPDIMAEFVDDTFPVSPPNDPDYLSQQRNLVLQGIDVAWQILAGAQGSALGSSAVTVCTIDSGIDLDHPDLGGLLSGGSPQLARCYDFAGMQECTAAGYAPDDDHGMGVVGIIAARTDNNEQIAGIAPGTRQICLKRPPLTSATYPCMLYWAAGFTTGNTAPGWPAEPLQPRADIISCSHSANRLAIGDLMQETYRELALNGRGGLGTVVICAAGKEGDAIAVANTWGAWPDNIAVGNTRIAAVSGAETREPLSNFGPELDLCAQGEGSWSLGRASAPSQQFNGTSAAAPIVAGVVALMLSRTSTLTRNKVVDILTANAVQVDPHNTDVVGKWVLGFSNWYGHGRVDAAAAVAAS